MSLLPVVIATVMAQGSKTSKLFSDIPDYPSSTGPGWQRYEICIQKKDRDAVRRRMKHDLIAKGFTEIERSGRTKFYRSDKSILVNFVEIGPLKGETSVMVRVEVLANAKPVKRTP